MRRWRAEDGQTATEYVGILALVAALVLAVAVAGMGGSLVAGVQRALCLLFQSGPCPVVFDDGVGCTVAADGRSIGAGVTIASVDVGGQLSWEKQVEVNDAGVPVYKVTLAADGDLGAAFGVGAAVEVTTGGNARGGGARVEGTAGATGSWTGGWEFATQAEADAFIDAAERFALDQAAMAAAGPLGGALYRQFVAESWDPPPMASWTVAAGPRGEASGGILGGDASGEASATAGYTQNADGSWVVYADVSPKGELGAGIPGFSATGGVEGSTVLELSYDPNGQLTKVTVNNSIAGVGAADLPFLSGSWMNPAGGVEGLQGQLTQALTEASVTTAAEGTVTLDVSTSLDLSKPAVRAAAEEYVAAVTGAVSDPARYARETSEFLQVLEREGEMTADVSTGTATPYGLEVAGAYGVKFGVEASYEDSSSRHLAGWRWDAAGNAFARRTDCVLAVGP